MRVEPFEPAHLWSLRELVNLHLEAVVPGWAITEAVLARHLERDDTEYVTDPWVVERATICAADGYRVLAAIHILRYGDGPDVGDEFHDLGEIGWLLFLPTADQAAGALLAAARDQMSAWQVTRQHGWGAGLPVGPFGGVPDTWPHVAAALETAGYRPSPERRAALYGGRLDGVAAPGDPPLPKLTARREVGRFGTRFAATLDGKQVGHCEAASDLTRGGALPALRGWAELAEIEIAEPWRNRGIGAWLVRRAVAWLRLGGCDRVILSVDAADETAGAGRFYRRFGWRLLARETRLWPHEASSSDTVATVQ